MDISKLYSYAARIAQELKLDMGIIDCSYEEEEDQLYLYVFGNCVGHGPGFGHAMADVKQDNKILKNALWEDWCKRTRPHVVAAKDFMKSKHDPNFYPAHAYCIRVNDNLYNVFLSCKGYSNSKMGEEEIFFVYAWMAGEPVNSIMQIHGEYSVDNIAEIMHEHPEYILATFHFS